ncbi:MAG: hypothetical protein E6G95_16285 [Alphaproteobacteria bacterium]|nr:MAG: hypothetical protein E6G95_16285 [Alphaproteobacteria bacterium]
MSAISIVLRSAVSIAVLAVATAAHADAFTDACMLGASPGTDMAKTCACMSTKVPNDVRADATEALRRTYQAMCVLQPVDEVARPSADGIHIPGRDLHRGRITR